MAETKKSDLELVTTVFDGYDDVPVSSPTTVFRNGKQTPLEVGEKFIIVKGNSKYFLPKESFTWNIQHGNTGWWCDFAFHVNLVHKSPDSFSEKMTDGTTYAVLESWYEQIDS